VLQVSPSFSCRSKQRTMTPDDLKTRHFENEFIYSTSRSSGPGGQNVNKISSKVEIRFDLLSTSSFTELEKEMIFLRLKHKINKEKEIFLVSQSERTQLMNKIAVTEKFYKLVSKALTIQKKRKPTRPTLTSKMKRLDTKRIHSNLKKLRKDTGESLI
jgi:ribosome-associated protein